MKRDHPRQPIIVPVGMHSRSLMERLRLVAAAYDDPFSAEGVARPKQRGGLKAKMHGGSGSVAA